MESLYAHGEIFLAKKCWRFAPPSRNGDTTWKAIQTGSRSLSITTIRMWRVSWAQSNWTNNWFGGRRLYAALNLKLSPNQEDSPLSLIPWHNIRTLLFKGGWNHLWKSAPTSKNHHRNGFWDLGILQLPQRQNDPPQKHQALVWGWHPWYIGTWSSWDFWHNISRDQQPIDDRNLVIQGDHCFCMNPDI